jgi:hypothetical protein
MKFSRSLTCIAVCCFLAFSSAAFADSGGERAQFGHDITVAPGETVTDVVCFGCSVRIRGHVSTDVTVFGGNVIVEDDGSIGTDVTTFGGNLRLDKGVHVGHDVTIFGGRLQRDSEASIGGDVTAFTGSFWMILIFVLPILFLAGLVALIVWIVRVATRRPVPAAA